MNKRFSLALSIILPIVAVFGVSGTLLVTPNPIGRSVTTTTCLKTVVISPEPHQVAVCDNSTGLRKAPNAGNIPCYYGALQLYRDANFEGPEICFYYPGGYELANVCMTWNWFGDCMSYWRNQLSSYITGFTVGALHQGYEWTGPECFFGEDGVIPEIWAIPNYPNDYDACGPGTNDYYNSVTVSYDV